MKVTKKIYLHWSPSGVDRNGSFGAFGFNAAGMSGYSEPKAIQDVEFDIPDFDPQAAAVDCLEREKAKKTAEYNEEMKQINDQIQRLLALDAPA